MAGEKDYSNFCEIMETTGTLFAIKTTLKVLKAGNSKKNFLPIVHFSDIEQLSEHNFLLFAQLTFSKANNMLLYRDLWQKFYDF